MELHKFKNQLMGAHVQHREAQLKRKNEELFAEFKYLKWNNNETQRNDQNPWTATPSPWVSFSTNDFRHSCNQIYRSPNERELQFKRKPEHFNGGRDGGFWSRGGTETRLKFSEPGPVLIPRDRKALWSSRNNQYRQAPTQKTVVEHRLVNQQRISSAIVPFRPSKTNSVQQPLMLENLKTKTRYDRNNDKKYAPRCFIAPIPVDFSNVKQEVIEEDGPAYSGFGFDEDKVKSDPGEYDDIIRKIKKERMDENGKNAFCFDTTNNKEGFANLAVVKQEKKDEYNENNFKLGDAIHDQIRFASFSAETFQSTNLSISNYISEMVLSENFGVNSIYPIKNGIHFHRHQGSTCLSSSQEKNLQQKFLNSSMFSSTFNPFPNHHLIIFIDDRNRGSFFELVAKLIKRFGMNVFYFTFYSEMNICPSYWYEQINELLKMMPNLQLIQIKIPPSGNDEDDDMFWSKELNVLKMACKPFPQFKQLIAIDFENVPYKIMQSALAQNNGTIMKLQITRTLAAMGNWNCSSGYGLRTSTFKKLTELSITCFEMKELRLLKCVNWLLKNLTVRLEIELKMFTNVDAENELFEVFKILEHFAETLTSLKITFYQKLDWDGRLHLPKLQNLEVYFVEEASFNFILGLRNLELLKVHYEAEQFGSTQDVIKFHSHIKDMTQSNIWSSVPTLKYIKTTTHYDDETNTYFSERPKLSSLFTVYR